MRMKPGSALLPGARPVTILVAIWLAGCDPVVSIAGAEFPDWLVCVMVGSTMAAACHPLLHLIGVEHYLRPQAFFYGSLILMFSLVTWVVFFDRA
jgi:hypothetical protein